jgi:uncharacterized protein (DUF1330 family)
MRSDEESRLKYYTIAEIEVTDPAWVDDYVEDVTRMVTSAGGRYLARTNRIEKVEGERHPLPMVLLIEWPDKKAVDGFYTSEAYAPYLMRRLAGSRSEMLVVAGAVFTTSTQ